MIYQIFMQIFFISEKFIFLWHTKNYIMSMRLRIPYTQKGVEYYEWLLKTVKCLLIGPMIEADRKDYPFDMQCTISDIDADELFEIN